MPIYLEAVRTETILDRSDPPPTAATGVERVLAHGLFPWLAAVVAVALLLPALSSGFQLDDHFQRPRLLGYGAPAIELFVFYDGDPATNRELRELGFLPWWSALELRHASFRYLSVLTMQLDYLLWPDRPELMHLHSLAWLAALVAAAAMLYRRILGPTWIAGLAALLFALDDAHAPPAAYLANRNALLSAFFGVLCLHWHARWRQEGWRAGAVLAPLALGLALASGEIALGAVAYLFAYACFLEPAGRRVVRRLATLLPCGVAFAIWAIAYEVGDFGTSGSGFYTDPLDLQSFGAAIWHRAPLLLLGQWTPIPSDLGSLFAPGTTGARAIWWLAIAVLAAIAAMLAPLLRRERVARFWCVGALLSLLPIAAVGPQDRLLFFVGLGSMPLLAQLVGAVLDRALPRSRLARGTALAAIAALLAIHLALAPVMTYVMLGLQRDANERMLRAVESVPADAAIAAQDLVLVNPPDQVYAVIAAPMVKSLRGEPVPRRLRSLTNGGTAMTLDRLDQHTLRVTLHESLFPTPFSRYYRSPDLPFHAGDRVAIGGLTVEVARLDQHGDPIEVVYRFDQALEDASLRWLVWDGERYVAWTPPAVGETVELGAQPGIFG
jgi:hypothetical protein